MKILIVGGAGFVGSQLAFYLKERGHEIFIMDNLARRGSEMNLIEFKKHSIPFIHGDIRNTENFTNLPKNIDVMCLTAAQTSVVSGYGNPQFDITNNAIGCLNCLEFARSNDCGFIFWSTNKVYGGDLVNQFPLIEEKTRWVWDRKKISNSLSIPGFDPGYGFSENFSIEGGHHSIYGLTKVMGDLACQEYAHAFQVPTVINRFSCIAGPNQFGKTEQGWVVWFAIAYYFNLPLNIIGWGGKQVRDVLFIDDVCRLIDLQINNLNHISGQVFNIGGGINNTLSLIEAMILLDEMIGKKTSINFDDLPRKADQGIYISDIRKAQTLLGWQPIIGINKGYQQILDWIKTNESKLRLLYEQFL